MGIRLEPETARGMNTHIETDMGILQELNVMKAAGRFIGTVSGMWSIQRIGRTP